MIQSKLESSPLLLREAAGLCRERLNILKNIATILDDASSVLGRLLKERKNRAEQLLRVGTILFLIPDPATTAASIPILLAGSLLRSRISLSPKDAIRFGKETIDSLSLLGQQLVLDTSLHIS